MKDFPQTSRNTLENYLSILHPCKGFVGELQGGGVSVVYRVHMGAAFPPLPFILLSASKLHRA